MEKKYGRATIIVSIVIMAVLALVVKWNHSRVFSIEKNMETTAYSVGEENIPLSEVMYYIMMEEDSVSVQAEAYDPENPRAYWNLFINGKYVSKVAAKTALNYAIRDDLYVREAQKAGVELTGEEKQDAAIKAEAIYEGMTEKQLAATNLTQEDLEQICERRALVNAYCIFLAGERGISMEESALQEAFGLESKYFDELLENYEVTINEKLWDQISLGAVTIN